MTREKNKQYLRNQIESCVIKQDGDNKLFYYLLYNKQYLRAKKLSKITGNIVNQNDFKGGIRLFTYKPTSKRIWCSWEISIYLSENYTTEYYMNKQLVEDVFNEYDQYKGYSYI